MQSVLETSLQELFEKSSPPKEKRQAFEKMLQIGLPTKEHEAFRYLRLTKLNALSLTLPELTPVTANALSPYVYPECEESYLVFINGHFVKSLSNTGGLPSKVIISDLKKAENTFGLFLQKQWKKGMQEEVDPFALANAALHPGGVFIYLPPGCVVERPIQILQVIDADHKNMMMMPRVQLFAGREASAEIISTVNAKSGSGFLSDVMHYELDAGARVEETKVCLEPLADLWHLSATRASLKRDAKFTSTHITNGSATDRQDIRISLEEENAEVLLQGMALLREKREAHVHILIDHKAPNCRSEQLFKNVLFDNSSSSFEGKILVQKEAEKTSAYQLNNNLLLSANAHADSKPNLEIFNGDVKASHGATIGQLKKDHLFYLRARGLPEKEAKEILIRGFCQQILDRLKHPSLQNLFTTLLK